MGALGGHGQWVERPEDIRPLFLRKNRPKRLAESAAFGRYGRFCTLLPTPPLRKSRTIETTYRPAKAAARWLLFQRAGQRLSHRKLTKEDAMATATEIREMPVIGRRMWLRGVFFSKLAGMFAGAAGRDRARERMRACEEPEAIQPLDQSNVEAGDSSFVFRSVDSNAPQFIVPKIRL
jgi:hypothetical protein